MAGATPIKISARLCPYKKGKLAADGRFAWTHARLQSVLRINGAMGLASRRVFNFIEEQSGCLEQTPFE
jgi:hypothetical protein